MRKAAAVSLKRVGLKRSTTLRAMRFQWSTYFGLRRGEGCLTRFGVEMGSQHSERRSRIEEICVETTEVDKMTRSDSHKSATP
jgi:hypothetical protein